MDTSNPNYHPALTTPGYEPQDGGHRQVGTPQPGDDPHRAPTEPGRESVELPATADLPPFDAADLKLPEVGGRPCDRVARCAFAAGHDGDCMPPPEFTPGQARYVTAEEGCERVRRAVVLPQMTAMYEATLPLRRLLRAAQNILHTWADVGDEELGELTHAAPGLHANIMNVSGFGAHGAELLDRAVGQPSEWAATFEAIVTEAHNQRAFRLLALASGALLVGPFTETWDNAVAWCIAFWRR